MSECSLAVVGQASYLRELGMPRQVWYTRGMLVLAWIVHYGVGLAQTYGPSAGLFMIGVALLLEARARRVGNLIQLTKEHRELWERMAVQPELARIIDPRADPSATPITTEEEMFVAFIILHLSSAYYAMRSGFFQKPHGLRKDIELFFSLPIPRAVWEKMKVLQDPPFVSFVERARAAAKSQASAEATWHDYLPVRL